MKQCLLYTVSVDCAFTRIQVARIKPSKVVSSFQDILSIKYFTDGQPKRHAQDS